MTLRELGKRVSGDVAVIGFDDIALARTTVPPLTTISQPVRKIATTAFKALLARIRYPNSDPREIFLTAPPRPAPLGLTRRPALVTAPYRSFALFTSATERIAG